MGFDFFVLVAVGLDFAVVDFFALVEVFGVVSVIGDELHGVWIDLDDGLDHGVHEVAVMGDHEDGTGVVEEVALEPEEGKEVEVVGGLV